MINCSDPIPDGQIPVHNVEDYIDRLTNDQEGIEIAVACESPRIYRRPVCLSPAAFADSVC